MTTAPDYHAPHVFLTARNADNWAMNHNPHPIASDDAKAWQRRFWDDQGDRLDRWTGGVSCAVVMALTLPLVISVMRP